MSKKASGDYEVGYGQPPKSTQFKKGQSGNPKGRPKRKADVSSLMEGALSEPVTLREGEETREMPAQEAVLYAQVRKAMAGDQTAFHAVMKQAQRHGLITTSKEREDDDQCGFLVVPDPVSEEEWLEMSRKHHERLRRREPFLEYELRKILHDRED